MAVWSAVAAGLTWAQVVDSYVLTNGAMGAGFAFCGGILAAQRTRNPIGWLLIAAGLAHLTSAALSGVIGYGVLHGWPESLLSLMLSVFNLAWPWGITLLLPLALQLFPDGKLVSKGWRWPFAATVVFGVGFVLAMGGGSEPLERARAHGRADVRPARLRLPRPALVPGQHGVDRRPGHRARRARGPLPPRRRPAAPPTAVARARADRRRRPQPPALGRRRRPDPAAARGAAGADRDHHRDPALPAARHPAGRLAGGALPRAQPRGRRRVHRPDRRPRRDPARRGRAGARHPPHRARLQPGAGAPAARRRPALLRLPLRPRARGVADRRPPRRHRRPRRRARRHPRGAAPAVRRAPPRRA